VPWEEIVKGYEVSKGNYVVMSDDDFKKVAVKRTNSIEILKFSDERDIRPEFFERPYYLEPDKGADKAYALLAEAMEKSGKVGIAKLVFRAKEHLAALKPSGGLLVVHTLRFADEVREPDLRLPARSAAKPAEMKMAMQLIKQMSGPFKPEDYQDDYTLALKDLIERKSKGKPLPKAEKAPQPTRVPDLVATLRKSLERPTRPHPEHHTVQ
jgi:DNA end-binding protein Ku